MASLILRTDRGKRSIMQPDEIRIDYVRQWLDRADQDLQSAEILLHSGQALGGIVAFHAQQAAEKYLKALLTFHQAPFPKTHDLGALIALAAPFHKSLPESLHVTIQLTDYAVDVRYPSDLPDVPLAESREAYRIALRAKEIILNIFPASIHGKTT